MTIILTIKVPDVERMTDDHRGTVTIRFKSGKEVEIPASSLVTQEVRE